MDITIFNEQKERIHTIDTFISLLWKEKYSSAGDFELYAPLNFTTYSFLQEDYYAHIPTSRKRMIIEEKFIKTDKEHGDVVIVKGRSLESIINRRIVWNQTMLFGNLQNSIHTLFCDSIINPSDENRRISDFIFEDSTDDYINSLNINLQLHGENLYNIITEICDIYNLGYELVLNENNQFLFRLYYGKDRSYDQFLLPWVIFSPDFDNLLTSEYSVDKKFYKTISLILGSGEGLERQAAVAVSSFGPGSGLNRREVYTDGSDIAKEVDGVVVPPEEYANQLITKGEMDLADKVRLEYFEGEIDHEVNFVYPNDFGLGDIVQIESRYGNIGKARVTEILHRIDETGYKIYPTFNMIN